MSVKQGLGLSGCDAASRLQPEGQLSCVGPSKGGHWRIPERAR